jgi:hypothetical protein
VSCNQSKNRSIRPQYMGWLSYHFTDHTKPRPAPLPDGGDGSRW